MVHTYITKEDIKTNTFKAPYIQLYTVASPNGYKITILLELLKIDYFVYEMDFPNNEQKEEWYLKLDPNGKVPSIDHVDETGKTAHINESAAILLYIADKFDKDYKYSFPYGTKEYYEMLEWMFFQMSGVGPMKGQYHWFTLFAPQKDDFAIERYYNETLRLFSVLERRLEQNNTGYLVGNKLSLADIINYPWLGGFTRIKELDDYPKLAQWVDNIEKIPGITSACQIPQYIPKY